MKLGYELRDTILHRMHPLSKIIVFFSAGTVFSTWMDFRYSLIGLIFALTLYQMGKVPRGWIKVLFATIVAGWSAIILWLPFQSIPGVFKVLPEEYALTPILELGDVPVIGRAVYTYGTVWIYLNQLVKSFTMTTMSMTLLYTTSPSDVTQILLAMGVPNLVSFSFMIFFRFSYVMSKAATVIVNSYRLRGWEGANSRNPFKFAKQIAPIMKGIGLQFMTTTNTLTLAVENRGFGAQRRVPHKNLALSKAEKAMMSVSVLAGIALFLLCIVPPYLGNI